MTRVFAIIPAFVFAASAAAAQPEAPKAALRTPLLADASVGRLFFTPSERAQLDIARTKKPTPAAPAASAPPPEPPPPPPQVVNYGGIIKRSDGKSMLWINNQVVDEKEALAGLNLKGRVRPDGSVTLQVPQTGGTIDVRVGQSVELQTGKVAEGKREPPKPKPTADAPAPAADGKQAPAESGEAAASSGSAATSKAAPEPPPAERKPQGTGAMGLKLDTGGRALDSAKK